MKITLHVSPKEFDALEDMLTSWVLCAKHNRLPYESEEALFGCQQKCKACKRKLGKTRKLAIRLMCKMFRADTKARKQVLNP